MRKIIITVDGPAGSGKSTVARKLADALRFRYLGTGRIYRAIAFLESCGKANEIHKVRFEDTRVIFEGRDITREISDEKFGMMASRISQDPNVRKIANEIQRKIVYSVEENFVVDGRDAGTVVFPEAQVKFFVTASLFERAKRRFKELEGVKFEEVLESIRKRDVQDRTRAVAPLKIPAGAVVIDTTELTPDEVVRIMLDVVKRFAGIKTSC